MTIPFGANVDTKRFGHATRTVASGTSAVVDTRGLSQVTVVTGAASTATISRVDTVGAVANSADTAANLSVTAGTRTTIEVDWPFYRVTAAGGTVRVGLGSSA